VARKVPGRDGTVLQVRPDVPVIMMSGDVQADEAELLRGLGVRRLVLKPHAVDELAEILAQVLGEG